MTSGENNDSAVCSTPNNPSPVQPCLMSSIVHHVCALDNISSYAHLTISECWCVAGSESELQGVCERGWVVLIMAGMRPATCEYFKPTSAGAGSAGDWRLCSNLALHHATAQLCSAGVS